MQSIAFADVPKLNFKDSEKDQIAEVDELIKRADRYLAIHDSLYTAIEILIPALDIANSCGYQDGIIKSANNLGLAYLTLSENNKATRFFYLAMKNAEALEDSTQIAETTKNLGLAHWNINDWQSAILHFEKALRIFSEENDIQSINLIEYLLGLSYYNSENFVAAKSYLTKSANNAQENNHIQRLNECRLFLNQIKATEDVDSAVLEEFNVLLDYFKDKGDLVGMCYTYDGRSKTFLALGDLESSYADAKQGLNLAKQMKLSYPTVLLLRAAINASYAQHDYKNAADYLQELEALTDSIAGLGESARITMLSADHEFNKKELQYDAELAQESRQKFILILLLIAALFILLAIFYAMRSVARERKKSDKLLLNILPLQTAKELKANGVAMAKAHENVTIVFADVVNFTNIAEDLAPQVIVQMLDKYFRGFDHIVTDLGLEKIKTIGDAYMFVAGLEDGIDSAVNAAKASAKMLDSITQLKDEMIESFDAHFDFRIGMHTGNVVSGVVGDTKYAFDIWGDAVNVAARAEATSEAGRVNLTEKTYDLIKGTFSCTARGEIELKNKGHLKMYFLNAPS